MGAKIVDKGVEEVLDAVESRASGTGGDPNLIELSTGVILRTRPVPRSLFADMLARFPAPKPPTVFIADKGREEENPDDPRYLAAVQDNQIQLVKAMSDAMILIGTEIESIPEGLATLDDVDWREEVHLLGYDIHGPRGWYLAWVKFKAIGNEADYQLVSDGVGRLMGVTEKDTALAARRFQSPAKRNGHR